jgi:hypothetical protein
MGGRRAKIVAGVPVVSADVLLVRLQHAVHGMASRGASVRATDAVCSRWRAWLWGRDCA